MLSPQPTNLSERNVSQNFASLDFQAAYALFSRVANASFGGPAGAVGLRSSRGTTLPPFFPNRVLSRKFLAEGDIRNAREIEICKHVPPKKFDRRTELSRLEGPPFRTVLAA